MAHEETDEDNAMYHAGEAAFQVLFQAYLEALMGVGPEREPHMDILKNFGAQSTIAELMDVLLVAMAAVCDARMTVLGRSPRCVHELLWEDCIDECAHQPS